MSSHHKSHGIMPYSRFVHVSLTNQKVHNTNVMYKQPIIQFMLSNSYTIKQHTISISTSYINHDIIPQALIVMHLDQTSK